MESPGFTKPTHSYGLQLPAELEAIVDELLFAGELEHGPQPELPEKRSGG